MGYRSKSLSSNYYNTQELKYGPEFMAMMIIDLLIALSLLGSHVTRSDQVNTTVTIPPGSALQDYLCSGPLQSNMTVVLEDGEHRIASQPTCNIITEGSVTMTGSLDSTKRTVVCCESKTSRRIFSTNVDHGTNHVH